MNITDLGAEGACALGPERVLREPVTIVLHRGTTGSSIADHDVGTTPLVEHNVPSRQSTGQVHFSFRLMRSAAAGSTRRCQHPAAVSGQHSYRGRRGRSKHHVVYTGEMERDQCTLIAHSLRYRIEAGSERPRNRSGQN